MSLTPAEYVFNRAELCDIVRSFFQEFQNTSQIPAQNKFLFLDQFKHIVVPVAA